MPERSLEYHWMTGNKKSLIFAGMILLFAVSGGFAQDAVILELTGTVELQLSGSSEWKNAVQGQTILPDSIISTGFKSSALIGIGNSFISIRPLTRLSFREISERSGTETVSASLQAGRVRFDVKAPAGSRSSFNIQSPVATASVRGTVFEMGIFELGVIEGSVEYSGISGTPVLVDAGRNSTIDIKRGKVLTPMQTLMAGFSLAAPIGSENYYPFEGNRMSQINNSSDVQTRIIYE